jgi:hypothetical protein
VCLCVCCTALHLRRVLSTHNSDVRKSKEPGKTPKSEDWLKKWATERKYQLQGLLDRAALIALTGCDTVKGGATAHM